MYITTCDFLVPGLDGMLDMLFILSWNTIHSSEKKSEKTLIIYSYTWYIYLQPSASSPTKAAHKCDLKYLPY